MAKLDATIEENQYREYIATSLQLIPQQKHITKSYHEILHPELTDNRTGDEIAEDVIVKAGLTYECI